jgi:hypothetical protein
MAIVVNEYYRTPFDPWGIVRVLELGPGFEGREIAYVRFFGDHPHGYKDGSLGSYFADELRPLVIPDCPRCGRRKVSHRGSWGHEGEPEDAWFECRNCEHQWSDYKLSEALMGLGKGNGT